MAQVVLDAVEGRELCAGLDLRGGGAVTALPANPCATRPSMACRHGARTARQKGATWSSSSKRKTYSAPPCIFLDSEAPILVTFVEACQGLAIDMRNV